MGYYSKQITKHKQDRWEAVLRQRSIVDGAESENRAPNTEEQSELAKLEQVVQDHENRIAALEKLDEVDGEPEMVDEPAAYSGDRSRRVGLPTTMLGHRSIAPQATAEYRDKFLHFMKTGERRDGLIVGTNSAGGYLIAPVQLTTDVVKAVDSAVFIRQLARVTKLNNAQAVGQRQITTRLGNVNMMTEINATDIDASLAFGRRDLTPNLASRTVKVSDKELELAQDILSIVSDELAYGFSKLQENKYINGSGSGEPLGLFTASASGIPTTQDVTSGSSADFTADDLIAMRYGIDQNYFSSNTCRWVIGRATAQKIRTFKDSQGRYLWEPGLVNASPDQILGVPVCVSEFAPTALTAGSYVAVLGDMSYYGIAEVGDLQVKRLEELYAATHQVGFRASWYFDGSPILGSAFARLKTGA